MRLATAQITAATNVCHAVVEPQVLAKTPIGEYWVVVDLDTIPNPAGKTYSLVTGVFT